MDLYVLLVLVSNMVLLMLLMYIFRVGGLGNLKLTVENRKKLETLNLNGQLGVLAKLGMDKHGMKKLKCQEINKNMPEHILLILLVMRLI